MGMMSTGNAGRPLMYRWYVERNADSNLAEDEHEVVNKFATVKSSTLTVANEILVPNRLYCWQLQVTNWLGKSHSVTVEVFKTSSPIPKIELDSSTQYVRKDEPLMAVVDIERSACDLTQELVMGGTQVTEHDFSLPTVFRSQVVLSQHRVLFLDKHSLEPGRTYVFRVQVTVASDVSIFSTAGLKVVVAISPLQASIVGGNRLVSISPGASGRNGKGCFLKLGPG
jgi:hypothetical protein